ELLHDDLAPARVENGLESSASGGPGRLGDRLEGRDALDGDAEGAAEAPCRGEADAQTREGARPRAHGDAVAVLESRPRVRHQPRNGREQLLRGSAVAGEALLEQAPVDEEGDGRIRARR